MQRHDLPKPHKEKSDNGNGGETIMLVRSTSLRRASGTPRHLMSPRMEVISHVLIAYFVKVVIRQGSAQRNLGFLL